MTTQIQYLLQKQQNSLKFSTTYNIYQRNNNTRQNFRTRVSFNQIDSSIITNFTRVNQQQYLNFQLRKYKNVNFQHTTTCLNFRTKFQKISIGRSIITNFIPVNQQQIIVPKLIKTKRKKITISDQKKKKLSSFNLISYNITFIVIQFIIKTKDYKILTKLQSQNGMCYMQKRRKLDGSRLFQRRLVMNLSGFLRKV
eukprot:TRINITY_DN17172_c0_g3_i2.p1 TRINITY_DN17172_c0_g3~~TRINITY_DN17172_c0_g3_i2.p1  ORF type:complete len:197 (+),score=-13.14 TRINITY_DN17172_c0_g3_i2:230-820(+)